MIDKRNVKKDGAIIRQVRYSEYGYTTGWVDLVRFCGDTRPRFFFGKSWPQCVEDE